MNAPVSVKTTDITVCDPPTACMFNFTEPVFEVTEIVPNFDEKDQQALKIQVKGKGLDKSLKLTLDGIE